MTTPSCAHRVSKMSSFHASKSPFHAPPPREAYIIPALLAYSFYPFSSIVGLSDKSVETAESGTALQLDASPPSPPPDAVVTSTIPPASQIGRRDVARLSVLSLREPKASRRILTCRWVNNNNNEETKKSSSSSRSQGAVAGSPTWAGEFAKVEGEEAPPPSETTGRALSGQSSSGILSPPKSRPYALAVAVVPLITVVAASLLVSTLRKLAVLAISSMRAA